MTRSTAILRAATALAVLCAAGPAAAFDKVLLKDGRLIEGKIVDEDREGHVAFEIRGMTIDIPHTLVDKHYIEDLEDYVPKNAKEEKHLKKGWVLFEGRWMSKARREQELEKRAREQEEAIAESRRMADWKNAQTVETAIFKIQSNATQEVLDLYVKSLEAFFKYFKDEWGITIPTELRKEKLKVYIYRSRRDYIRIGGGSWSSLGYFRPDTAELHLFYDVDDVEGSLNTLYHEFNHLITFLLDPGFLFPRWINESMAEYFGSAVMDEKGDFTVGGLQFGRIAHMQATDKAGRGLTPKQVLLTPHSKFGGLHYAVGWSFVHFMMESPKYSKKFSSFFRTLPNNKDVPKRNRMWVQGSTIKEADEDDVLEAMLKRLGTDLETLDDEWREWTRQAYGEMPAKAYHSAARQALRYPQEDSKHVEEAFEFFEKAVQGGVEDASCYRQYAEMLRKGGVVEYRNRHVVRDPDPVHAWEIIQIGLRLDPVNAYGYCEAAGILLMESEVQDIDLAGQMAITARALAPNSSGVRGLYDELVTKIRAARDARKLAADAEKVAVWRIQPYYIETEERPEHIVDLSTDDIRKKIEEGELDGNDWAFNGVPAMDPETGERPPREKWDSEWVQLKDIPWFRADLEAAGWEFESGGEAEGSEKGDSGDAGESEEG